MADRAAQLAQILTGLVDGRTRFGAAVVTRDGLPVVSKMTRPVSEDSFSAMAAALLGAAEGALQEFADDRPQTAVVEGKSLRLTLAGLDGDFVLAMVGPASMQMPAGDTERVAAQLRAVLKQTVVQR